MGKGGVYSKAAKGVPTEEASMPCKGRSAGKRVEESRERESSACGKAMRSAARVKKELSGRIKEESREVLWQGNARKSMPTRVRIVHERSNSDICAVQKIWREGVSYRGK